RDRGDAGRRAPGLRTARSRTGHRAHRGEQAGARRRPGDPGEAARGPAALVRCGYGQADRRMKIWPYPRWVAHRGAGKLARESTLAAFRLGAEHGYRMFECDVKLSADGVPFLMHDATLERTTNGVGTGGDQPWDQLARLDAGSWHSRRHAGE